MLGSRTFGFGWLLVAILMAVPAFSGEPWAAPPMPQDAFGQGYGTASSNESFSIADASFQPAAEEAPLPLEPAEEVIVADQGAVAAGCPNCQLGPCACSPAKKAALKKAAAGSHKGVFFNNNFSYLDDPCNDSCYLGDSLKGRGIGDCITVDVGGQYRLRYHNERNIRGLGLTGVDDDFLLHRTRIYTDVKVGERFRVYAELLDAVSNYENFGPRPIEENRADMENLFGDFKVFENGRGELWLRAGRQELLYGNQRTVSPLDWANTRRTFEGYKAFWKGSKWDVDAFYTRPVSRSPKSFDSANYDQEFMGFYATNHACEHRTVDFYYLRFNNQTQAIEFDTLGARLSGDRDGWLYEAEGAVQFGNFGNFDHNAGAWTVGLGRKLPRMPWNSTLWAYYDWASGDGVQGNGYHHMFPLAHKYLGFMDLFGRRNIKDANLLLTMKPHEKIRLLMWYHIFSLETRQDVPYSVAMTPFNPGNLPQSSDLGQELDCVLNWTLNPRTNLLFGYSHFFSGNYYDATPGVPFSGDADFFYTQLTVNF